MAGLIIGISSRPDILRIIRRRTPGRKTRYNGVQKLTGGCGGGAQKVGWKLERPSATRPTSLPLPAVSLAVQGVQDSGVFQGHLLLTNGVGRRPSTQTC